MIEDVDNDYLKDMYKADQRLKLVDLKIPKEVIEKHLKFHKEFLSITCDQPHADIGDIVLIDEFVYTIMNEHSVNLKWLINHNNMFWVLDGSKSKDEYISKIKTLYGNDLLKPLYVYALRIVEWRK